MKHSFGIFRCARLMPGPNQCKPTVYQSYQSWYTKTIFGAVINDGIVLCMMRKYPHLRDFSQVSQGEREREREVQTFYPTDTYNLHVHMCMCTVCILMWAFCACIFFARYVYVECKYNIPSSSSGVFLPAWRAVLIWMIQSPGRALGSLSQGETSQCFMWGNMHK